MSEQELKACPKCQYDYPGSGYCAGMSYIYCPSCGIKTKQCSGSKAAIDDWNERTPDPIIAELVELVRYNTEIRYGDPEFEFPPRAAMHECPNGEYLSYRDVQALSNRAKGVQS